MSSAPEKPPGPQNQTPPERFNTKLILIWAAILAIIGALLFVTPGPRSHTEQKTVSQIAQDVEEGKIKSLEMTQDQVSGDNIWIITGEMLPEQNAKAEAPKPVLKGLAKPSEGIRFRAKGWVSNNEVERIKSRMPKDAITWPEPRTHLEFLAIQIIPSIVIGGLIIFFIYRLMKNANRGAMSFAKSKAKLLGKDKERAGFKDVAGCDEAKQDVQEVVEYLRDPKKFRQIGARIPRGVLLIGPPGTGKTLLARAVAGEANVPFYSISGSDFVEMFVGVGAARVRDMFEQARKSAPAIIFIDEIDAVGRKRAAGSGMSGGHDEREQTLNSLLVEMDGIEGHEGIIVVAATNRADVLDEALLRPGRFDRHVYVDLPDIRGREEILRVHAVKVKLAEKVDLAHIARITTGCSGAQLANLLNEAALLAARRDKKEIDTVDIEEANDKIAFGAERRKLMDEEDRRSTAYHEAGHAIIQALLDDANLKLHKVTIIPRGRALGMAMFKPGKEVVGHSKTHLLNRVCVAMAGRIGEEVATGDFSNGASMDIKQATRIARMMVCDWGMSSLGPVAFSEEREPAFVHAYSDETARRIDAEVSRIVEEQFARARELVSGHADAHRKIAEALLEFETLDAVHVHEIITHGAIRTPVEYRPMSRRERDEDRVAAAAPVGEKTDDSAEASAPPPLPA